MEESTIVTTEGSTSVTDGGKPVEAHGQRSLESLPEELRGYIKELRKEAENNRKRAQELEAQVNREKQDKLQAQGDYKTLSESLQVENEALKAQLAEKGKAEAALLESNERRITQLPPDIQGIVPRQLPPHDLSKWLDDAAPLLKRPTPPTMDAGTRGTDVATPSKVELTPLDLQAMQGMSDKERKIYLESVAKRKKE